MDRPVPASFWRGGTSRAVLFAAHDLAAYDADQVDAVILAALGSPDPDGRQIDGLGGGSSSLSKAAIVGAPPPDSPADVAYRFAQVEVSAPLVDFTGNCGNISAAIGPFAVDAGLIEPTDGAADGAADGATEVTVLSANTGQLCRARVPTRQGRYEPAGDFAIQGVPGTASRIALTYIDAGGSVGLGPLPTGAPCEPIGTGDGRSVSASIVDLANPAVFVRADEMGATATAPAGVLDSDRDLQARLEHVRCEAAVRIGLAASLDEAARRPTIPKVAMVGPAAAYGAGSGQAVTADSIDVAVRLISMRRTHRTVALTGAMALAGAAAVPGTVVADAVTGGARPDRTVRIGHPAGVIEVGVTAEQGSDGSWRFPAVRVDRTAREIMRGSVLVPEVHLAGNAWYHEHRRP